MTEGTNIVDDFTGPTVIVKEAERGIGPGIARCRVGASANAATVDRDENVLVPAACALSASAGLHSGIGQASCATADTGLIGFTTTAATALPRLSVTGNAVWPNAGSRMIASLRADNRRRRHLDVSACAMRSELCATA